MSSQPARMASVGMRRCSEVLAEAIQCTPWLTIVNCATRSGEKGEALPQGRVQGGGEPQGGWMGLLEGLAGAGLKR